MIMDDCGSITLKQFMLQDTVPIPLANAIGTALGEFLGRLHTWGRGNQQVLDFFDVNHEMRAIAGWISYGRLVSSLTGEDDLPKLADPPVEVSDGDLEIISKIATEMTIANNTSHETFTMGDFWPGNMMISFRSDTENGPRILEHVHVLDWEAARYGVPGLDVGQFCAEMHLLRRFNPPCAESASTTITTFLESYRRSYQFEASLPRIAMSHVGAHLVAWTPRIPWGSKELTREVVKEGIEFLVQGYAGTDEWLRRSLVSPLV